jgi:membrane protein YdbS with pleckstrin-like domain
MAAKTPEILTLLRRTYPFKNYTPEMLDTFINYLTIHEPADNQEIFSFGQPADRFFIVLVGRIRLERMNQNNEYSTFSMIDMGEFFGLEAVKPRTHYRVRAIATRNTKILSISNVDLLEMQRTSPDLYRLLTILHNSFEALVEMRLSWKEKDENVFLSIRKHPLFLWGKILIPVIIFLATFITVAITSLTVAENFLPGVFILLGALVVTAIPALYFYIDWKDDFYMITDRKVLSRQRDILLYETKNIIPYNAVQSVTKKIPDTLAAVFQYGDINIRTYTGVLTLKSIAHPEVVISLISDIRTRQSIIQEQYSREENMLEMRKRLGLEQPAGNSTDNGNTSDSSEIDLAEDDSFRLINSLFQSLFQLRVVKGDEVTYRKHWLILLDESKFYYAVWTLITIGLVYSLLAFAFINFPLLPWPVIISLAVAWLVFSAILAYRFEDWRNDRFVLTNRVIMDLDKKPFGKENRRTAPLERIQAVEYKREGILHILFNFGTVYIRVGDQQFTFDEVANPFAVQQEITGRLNQAKDRDRRNEINRERDTILDWIEIYHTVTHVETNEKSTENTPDEDEDIIHF